MSFCYRRLVFGDVVIVVMVMPSRGDSAPRRLQLRRRRKSGRRSLRPRRRPTSTPPRRKPNWLKPSITLSRLMTIPITPPRNECISMNVCRPSPETSSPGPDPRGHKLLGPDPFPACRYLSGFTRMIFLPKFPPFNNRISSRGAFSSPSVMSSRYLIRPSRSQAVISLINSGNCEA
jgi:hypothetical protein